MSGLNILKHSWKVFLELRKEEPQKIRLSKIDTFLLGCSVSYILTVLFTGLNI
jgi:hypothetical protein